MLHPPSNFAFKFNLRRSTKARLGKIPEGDDAYTKPRARLKVLARSLNARLRETLESLQEARHGLTLVTFRLNVSTFGGLQWFQ